MSNRVSYVDAITIMAMLKNTCKKHGLRKWCRSNNLDPGNVSSVINLKKPMQRSIANALGFMPVVVYKSITEHEAVSRTSDD